MPTLATRIGHLRSLLARRWMWVVLFLLLLSAAAVLLRAQGGAPGAGNTPPLLDGRPCQSKGTVFEDLTAITDLTTQFENDVTAVVEERLSLFADDTVWSCVPGASNEPPQPVLEDMATSLPGWHRRDRVLGGGVAAVRKPVESAAFSSILGEYLRAYECRILELESDAIATVSRGGDLPKGTLFCCASNGCIPADTAASCSTPPSPDPTCGNTCAVGLTGADIVLRPTAYAEQLHAERTRARIALERTLWTLRSFEQHWTASHDLSCLMRASLDLQAEMHLLATAASCLPRIWDAVTSLHDRTPFPAP